MIVFILLNLVLVTLCVVINLKTIPSQLMELKNYEEKCSRKVKLLQGVIIGIGYTIPAAIMETTGWDLDFWGVLVGTYYLINILNIGNDRWALTFRVDDHAKNGFIQAITRFTWELPQTLVGQFTILFTPKARIKWIDGVVILGTMPENFRGIKGMSLGVCIRMWGPYNLSKLMVHHEYGHTLDSRRFGWLYLPVIGLSSFCSAEFRLEKHSLFWTERRANRLAKNYFSKHYNTVWIENEYPTKKRA